MKQATFILLTFLFISSLALNSCNEAIEATGPIKDMAKVVAPAKNIFNDIDADVNISIDSTAKDTKYIIHAQQAILDNLDIKVDKGEMVITYKDGIYINSKETITIDVITSAVESIKLLGSGNMTTKGAATSQKMLCSIMGSGNIIISDITTGKLVLEIAGSGTIETKNCTALKAEYALKGSGDIKAATTTAGEVKAQVSGSGDIYVTAVEELDAEVTGSGNIKYQGEPKKVKSNITGSGEIAKSAL